MLHNLRYSGCYDPKFGAMGHNVKSGHYVWAKIVLLVEVFSKGLQIGPFSMTHYGEEVHIVYELELDLWFQ